MFEIHVICTIMIIVEIYHFIFHNKIRAMCQPFFDRVKFLSKFQKTKADFYAMRVYATKHPSNKCISKFAQVYDSKLDVIDQMFNTMPSSAELIDKFIGRTSPRTVRFAIMSTIIELVYLALFIRLLYLLPSGINWFVGIIIVIFSAFHSINEYGEKMMCWWYPFIDSIACALIYGGVILYTFMV